MFQYFIGNTDWSALAPPAGEEKCCHNVVPYARPTARCWPCPTTSTRRASSDAPYPLPDERLPIQDVRQRLFRGRCRELAALEPVFALFIAQRAAITQLFSPAAGLTEKSAQRATAYIDDFYAVLGDGEEIEKRFRSGCNR